MVLIIPMSGKGKRFLSVGYQTPKPLISVDGKPAVSHVLDMYPDEKNVIFICNKEHLEKTLLKKTLEDLKPESKIVSINPHDLGPVHAIRQAYDLISDHEEVLISYCDFTGLWDYNDFKKMVKEKNADGAIPAYIGFHPHLLGNNFYGHMKWDEKNFMIEIKEKESFTNNKMEEYGAVGSYWFKSGKLMKYYFNKSVELNLKTGSEFFCSLPYNLMVRDGLKVLIYEMEKFCQWGTPEDLEEYEAWSRAFAVINGNSGKKGMTEIPFNREQFVKARQTHLQYHSHTFSYWQKFFSKVPWHPYGK